MFNSNEEKGRKTLPDAIPFNISEVHPIKDKFEGEEMNTLADVSQIILRKINPFEYDSEDEGKRSTEVESEPACANYSSVQYKKNSLSSTSDITMDKYDETSKPHHSKISNPPIITSSSNLQQNVTQRKCSCAEGVNTESYQEKRKKRSKNWFKKFTCRSPQNSDSEDSIYEKQCTHNVIVPSIDENHEYHVKKGFGLIISSNFRNWGKFERTKGNQKDIKECIKLMDCMGFKYNILEDYSKKNIIKCIKNYSSNKGGIMTGFDCLMLIIMTHGGRDEESRTEYIYTSKTEKIKLDWILSMFSNNNCKVLIGKPKIFILQHCRGERVDHGKRKVIADGMPGNKSISTIPKMSEFIICQSSFEGYESYLTNEGSWFIQSVVSVLTEGIPQQREFHLMMLQVHENVSKDYDVLEESDETRDDCYLKQAPCLKTSSTKEIYLPWKQGNSHRMN